MIYHGYTVDTAYVQDGGLKWVTTGCGYYITATKGGSRYFIKRNTVYRRPLPGEKCAALAKKNREGAAFIEGKQTEIARRMKKFTLADGIVRELDHFWDDDTNTYVTVTEYISGELAPSAVPAGERAALIAQIANSLAALHDAGVGHFDIKVKNIVIRKTTGGYQGVFVDFDNSYPDNELPEGDKIPFTPGYEAPEVVLHESGLAGADDRITLAKDVFSLGIVFHELLVGDVDLVVHQRGIAQAGANDLQAFIQKIVRRVGRNARGKVGPGNLAFLNGAQDDIRKRVSIVAAIRACAANANVDNIVVPQANAPLINLDKGVFEQLLRALRRKPARGDIRLIKRIQILVDPAQRHRVAFLQAEANVAKPHQLQRVGKTRGRMAGKPTATRGNFRKPFWRIALAVL